MLFLAIRHLLSRKRQTALTLLGIVLGATAYVVISGMMLGFREFLVDQLINNDAHIRISAREDRIEEHSLDRHFFQASEQVIWSVAPYGRKIDEWIENPQGWYRRIEEDPRVEAYSQQVTSQVMLRRGNASVSGKLVGSDPRRQARVTNIASYMVEGRFSDIANGGNRIIVGADLLQTLGAKVYDSVLVSNGRDAPVPFKIVGVFKTGIRPLDEGTVYGAIADAQRINSTPSQVNEIAVRLKDVSLARQIATDWAAISRERVQSWDQASANFLAVFKMQDAIRYLMTVSILLVAGFGIYNILNMVVTQKRREIAILRSMGYTAGDVLFLFFIQGMTLGALGGVVGLGLGYGISRFLETLKIAGPAMGGKGAMMVSFNPEIYLFAFVLALFASAVASVLPARVAGRLTPIDIIRSGE